LDLSVAHSSLAFVVAVAILARLPPRSPLMLRRIVALVKK
jgi:hypothetical protein